MKIGYFGTMVLILVFFAAFTLGQMIYEQDYEAGVKRDIYNYTETKLTYENIQTNKNNTDEVIYVSANRLNRVIESFTNFIFVSGFEGMKFGVEYGYEHPEVNYKFITENIVNLFKWIVYLMIALLCIKLLLPLFVIIYITGELIYTLIKKIKNKKGKEKKK